MPPRDSTIGYIDIASSNSDEEHSSDSPPHGALGYIIGLTGSDSEGGGYDTKQCATLLGLQVQSVIERVIFPNERTQSLYQTLGEQSKKLSSF
jgi:hypothetical protein